MPANHPIFQGTFLFGKKLLAVNISKITRSVTLPTEEALPTSARENIGACPRKEQKTWTT